jgi:hypothetical protein
VNRLELSLQQRPRQIMAQECRVCRQLIDPDDRTEVQVALFGAARYGVCCCCRQEAPDHKDKNYRARWRRWRSSQH